jgi:hypothetical protein
MKEKAPDIIDDFTLVSPPDPYAWVWPVAIGLILLVIAALILWRIYRKKALSSSTSAATPDVAARDGLAASRRLLDEEKYHEFVIEVSRVLRFYIEERFTLRAPHLSTEEFLFEAERSDRLTDEWQKALGDFLFQCDRVKFALAHTEPPRMEALYSTAENFINQTAAFA